MWNILEWCNVGNGAARVLRWYFMQSTLCMWNDVWSSKKFAPNDPYTAHKKGGGSKSFFWRITQLVKFPIKSKQMKINCEEIFTFKFSFKRFKFMKFFFRMSQELRFFKLNCSFGIRPQIALPRKFYRIFTTYNEISSYFHVLVFPLRCHNHEHFSFSVRVTLCFFKTLFTEDENAMEMASNASIHHLRFK